MLGKTFYQRFLGSFSRKRLATISFLLFSYGLIRNDVNVIQLTQDVDPKNLCYHKRCYSIYTYSKTLSNIQKKSCQTKSEALINTAPAEENTVHTSSRRKYSDSKFCHS